MVAWVRSALSATASASASQGQLQIGGQGRLTQCVTTVASTVQTGDAAWDTTNLWARAPPWWESVLGVGRRLVTAVTASEALCA